MLRKLFVPIFVVVTTFIVATLFIVIARANPLEVFYHMFVTPFTTRLSILEIFAQTIPLILTGMTVVVAFTGGYYNIGGEGQLFAGAIAATWAGLTLGNLHPLLLVPMAVALGFIGGSLWSAIAAVLKLKFNSDEVFTTLIMNPIIAYLATRLVNGPWRDPAYHSAQSPLISPNAYFLLLVAQSRVHLGLVIALFAAVLVAVFLKQTTLGFEIRAVGANPDAARHTGMNVKRTLLLAAVLSGGLAGIAGAGEVLGVHHRLIATLSQGLGYAGIVVAKLAGLNPWLTILAAGSIATVDVGAQWTSIKTGVPIQLGGIIKWTLFLSVLAGVSIDRYVLRRR